MSLPRVLTTALVAGATTVLVGANAHLESGVDLQGPYLAALEGVSPEGASSARAAPLQDANAPYDGLFHFVRVRYEVGGRRGFGGFGRRRGGREPMWAHDYPRAERNFLAIMDETTYVRPQTQGSNILTFDDPEIFKYPIAYIVEIGAWNPKSKRR